MPRSTKAEERHREALAFGQKLLDHRWPVPLVVAPPRPRTRAEQLLLDRDWMRIEDAYEQLDGDEQLALDLGYGLRPGDARRRDLGEVAESLDVGQATAATTLSRAVQRLDQLL